MRPDHSTRLHLWTAALGCAFCVVMWPLAAAHSLPTGYKEDFNGCANTLDKTEREDCCKSVVEDCHDKCEENHKNDKSAQITCSVSCSSANQKCRVGDKVEGWIPWPGQIWRDVPDLKMDGHAVVPDEGASLQPSSDAVVVEVHRKPDEPDEPSCVAFVATCSCAERAGDSTELECRAVVKGDATECRLCPPDASDERCKPCEGCGPVVRAAYVCNAPESDYSPVREKNENGKR